MSERNGTASASSPSSPPRSRGKRPATAERRSNLRFETLNAFVDTGMRHLSPAEAAVWIVLYRDTKPDGTARTSVGHIVERCGLSRSTVLRALKALEQKRMLRIEQKGALNRGPSRYIVIPYPAPDDWG